jgi:membrane protein DedA with SNARE-associated domain
VEDFLLQTIGGASGGLLAYGIVFGILMLCGLGLPLPEDVSLILGGFLVYQGKADLVLMMLVGYLGIIIGDSMIYYLGRRVAGQVGLANPNKAPGFLARIVTPEKRARVETLFEKHGQKIVMLARFLPGVRTPTYFTAGSVGMRYRTFAFYDSVAALASAPVFVWLGFKFGDKLESLIEKIRQGQIGVLAVTALAIVIGVLWTRYKNKREARLNAEALAQKINISQGSEAK